MIVLNKYLIDNQYTNSYIIQREMSQMDNCLYYLTYLSSTNKCVVTGLYGYINPNNENYINANIKNEQDKIGFIISVHDSNLIQEEYYPSGRIVNLLC